MNSKIAYADEIRFFIAPPSQAKGEDYFRSGRVADLLVEGPKVSAVVFGKRAYFAVLDPTDKEFMGECDCPTFQAEGPCEHLWALALAADSHQGRSGTQVPLGFESELSVLAATLKRLGITRDRALSAPPKAVPKRESAEDWAARLKRMAPGHASGTTGVVERAIRDLSRVDYLLDLHESMQEGTPAIRAFLRTRKKNGEFGARKEIRFDFDPRELDLNRVDQELLNLLKDHNQGSRSTGHGYENYYDYRDRSRDRTSVVGPFAAPNLISRLAETGRLLMTTANFRGRETELSWDGGEPWRFRLRLEPGEVKRKKVVTLIGDLVRGDETMALEEPYACFGSGLVFVGSIAARFDPRGAMKWVAELRRHGPLVVPAGKARLLAENLAVTAHEAWEVVPLDDQVAGGRPLEAELAVPELAEPELPGPRLVTAERIPAPPKVTLEVGASTMSHSSSLPCTLKMDYGTGAPIDPRTPAGLIALPGGEGWMKRDLDFEVEAMGQMYALGVVPPRYGGPPWHGELTPRDLPKVVQRALALGWSVKAEGKAYRSAGAFRGSVSSGVDWFDLQGGLDFDGEVAPLPAILAAARQGQRHVQLGDGSFGVLPENWLQSWGLLELAGRAKGENLRFEANQGWILDALLSGRDDIASDAGFERYRQRLDSFTQVKPGKEPHTFQGELRSYQRLAIGWFQFLRDLGLGGCLADDMGLGKTVQVLALLEDRRLSQRKLEGGQRPTLVVAPNSLVFNWIAEAARFAPKIRALDYTGAERRARAGDMGDWDLVVTTYGTLRRDAVELAEIDFDYVVLDEATAIKNAASQAAKSARLMRARHRLALSGTPIENHLGELWSLFEFLNPGMLGGSTAFKRFAKGSHSPEDLAALSKALAPFFLRRTKKEVLKDLPEKTEQVVMCELGKAERKRYDEVRAHFRSELLGGGGGEDDLMGSEKIRILEALLRLRQCACHPALMDESLMDEPSAKLEELLPRLQELIDEGHKVLVFSQFTSFLKVVRARLDALGLAYEYLDGSTRDRKSKVERFQTDETCTLFLISIKAGGHGLNLTAADYVFILDPWWNPAVEAQAVDRAHRMGQVKPVFAYRLIAKDTVEEKVLELQGEKRALAEAVIGEGSGVLRDLTRGDLERLLS